MEEIVVEIVHRVFNLDSLESSHRINIPVSNPDEIFEVFDEISYNKGQYLSSLFCFLWYFFVYLIAYLYFLSTMI